MLNFLRRMGRLIQKMISWFPIIWNDYDWDHVYFYIILRHKLGRMEKFFRSSNAWSMKAEGCADEIKKCILTLDRLIKDDYYSLAGGEILNKKWGNLEMEFTSAGFGENKKKYRQLLITRKNVITFEDSEISDREFDVVRKREEELRKQDLKYLFEQLDKHIVSWWD